MSQGLHKILVSFAVDDFYKTIDEFIEWLEKRAQSMREAQTAIDAAENEHLLYGSAFGL